MRQTQKSRGQNRKPFFNSLATWSFFVLGLLIPVQLGRHFWPSFSFLNGVRSDFLSPTIYLTDLLLIGAVFLNWPDKWPKIKKSVVWVGAVLLLINFVAVTHKPLFLYRLYQYLKIALAAWLFYRAGREDRSAFVKGMAVSAVYTLFLSVWQIRTQGSLQGFWWFLGERAFTVGTPGIATVSIGGQKLLRAYATFSHPNSLGGFFATAAALFLLHRRLRVGVLLAVSIVILSFSKAALLSLALVFLLWQLSKSNDCRPCRVVGWLFPLWLGSLVFLFRGSPDTFQGRLDSWGEAVAFLAKNPLGTSLGHYLYPLLSPRYQPVHNAFLLVFLEIGLVGGVALFYILSKALVNRIKTAPARLLPWVPVCLTAGLDHYWLTLPQNMILLGAVIGLTLGVPASRRGSRS